MVFIVNQPIAFYEENHQIYLPQATSLQLVNEVLDNVPDLLEFDGESIKGIADNLRRPGGRIPNPEPNAAPGDMILTPHFSFGAKSQMRLKAVTMILRYYETVCREIIAPNMRWKITIKSFVEHCKYLEEQKKEADVPDVPKIKKHLDVTKWTESFADFLDHVMGRRTVPLSYVIKNDYVVPAIAPPLAAIVEWGLYPYSTEYGSVEGELVAQASHSHALFRNYNAQVYHYLEEVTRCTAYASSIKPFQRRIDGRGAWNDIIAQYAVEDKWRAKLKIQDDLLHSRKWKGQSNYTLKRFVAQHRNAFISMNQCAEHVD